MSATDAKLKLNLTPMLTAASVCLPSRSRWRAELHVPQGLAQSGGAGAPGERALRRRSLPAGRAQRLPAAASPRIPGQLPDVHAAEPGSLPGGRLGAAGAAHGDQRQEHTREPEGEDVQQLFFHLEAVDAERYLQQFRRIFLLCFFFFFGSGFSNGSRNSLPYSAAASQIV